MSSATSFEETIPSDTSEGLRVQARILDLVADHGFTERDVFGIRLSLEEAIVNAIKHGNKYDLNKQVRIAWKLHEGELFVEIEDQGAGFRPEEVPDPTAPENLDRPSGRGLMLMRNFMDGVMYSEKGNFVAMRKRRSEAG
jgi:serine/threonine-protein kinase RsbW